MGHFSGSMFGNSGNSSGGFSFGGSNANSNSGGGLFGNTSSSTSGGGLFGGGSSGFGSNTGTFGSSNTNSNTGMFGNTNNTSSTGLFGNNSSTTFGGGSAFGGGGGMTDGTAQKFEVCKHFILTGGGCKRQLIFKNFKFRLKITNIWNLNRGIISSNLLRLKTI